jgi:hypothetical protein
MELSNGAVVDLRYLDQALVDGGMCALKAAVVSPRVC